MQPNVGPTTLPCAGFSDTPPDHKSMSNGDLIKNNDSERLKKGAGQVYTALQFSSNVVVMDVLYLNSMINHCVRKTTLSGDVVSE